MDWTLVIIGTLTVLVAVLAVHLIWREKKHSSSNPPQEITGRTQKHGNSIMREIINVTKSNNIHEQW